MQTQAPNLTVYSIATGVTVGTLPVNLRSEGSVLGAVQWSDGEFIKQTASGGRRVSLSHVFSCVPGSIGIGGQFAVLSSSNRVFYGTLSYGSAIEVCPRSPPVVCVCVLGSRW